MKFNENSIIPLSSKTFLVIEKYVILKWHQKYFDKSQPFIFIVPLIAYLLRKLKSGNCLRFSLRSGDKTRHSNQVNKRNV